MKLGITEDEKLDGWEALIDTVDKTDIPIAFVRNINIMFLTPVDNVDEQDIDIQRFRKDGFDDNGLDEIVKAVFTEHHNNIKSVHFYVDVKHVAEVAQRQTNILLQGMK